MAAGSFERIGYDGSGEVALVALADGGHEVRLGPFSVEEGPALRVYLSVAPAGSAESAYDDDFVDLGELSSFEGAQVYAVPDGTAVNAYASVVIWCAEFSVGFVVAPLDR